MDSASAGCFSMGLSLTGVGLAGILPASGGPGQQEIHTATISVRIVVMLAPTLRSECPQRLLVDHGGFVRAAATLRLGPDMLRQHRANRLHGILPSQIVP